MISFSSLSKAGEVILQEFNSTLLRALRLQVFLSIIMLIASAAVSAQVVVKGTVYDMSRTQPLESVSVLTNSGEGTITDIHGNYSITARETDSLWFSYLNKPTPKFAVSSIVNTNQFDISLHVASTTLKEVMVRPRDYRQDSIQNRLDYAKAFNFKKPGLSISSLPSDSGGPRVSLHLDGLF